MFFTLNILLVVGGGIQVDVDWAKSLKSTYCTYFTIAAVLIGFYLVAWLQFNGMTEPLEWQRKGVYKWWAGLLHIYDEFVYEQLSREYTRGNSSWSSRYVTRMIIYLRRKGFFTDCWYMGELIVLGLNVRVFTLRRFGTLMDESQKYFR